MTNQNDYKKLYETEKFVIGHIYENAYLIEKVTKKSIFIGSFYGDPECALISRDNTWGLIGGSSLLLLIFKELIEIHDVELDWIRGLRQTDNFKVEILTDPFSDNSAIWEFNILTKEKRKIKDFPKYKGKPYSENIEW
ncbi:hypothetical protein [Flavobacterium suncheonense]|uniref:Uncharacterized protein n=1 Tax=Flavobacterium suncheonense GH29-5 = DSM 17707 TaxID=1121899 RepID=A0A0A2M532_9FLAO|nr:hypothetical protein [Flavobacterium suncheonense]KGO86681.1 hypothetical protein Q764_13485 [Flavobacterium suncheonense GH29-5 = DSM 17707]